MASPTADAYQVGAGEDVFAGRGGPSRAALNVTDGEDVFSGTVGTSPTALAAACLALVAGTVTALPNDSLNTAGTNGSKPWERTVTPPGSVTLLDWANVMDYDPTRGQIYTAGGRPYGDPTAQKCVFFDESSNVWDSIVNPWGLPGGHIYNGTTLAPEHGLMLSTMFGAAGALGGGSGWIYKWDLDTHEYVGVISPPANAGWPWDTVSAITWVPTLGTQGSIVFFNRTLTRTMRFDWASQTWSQLGTGASYSASPPIAIYLPNAGIAIVGSCTSAGSLVIVDASDGSVSATASPPVTVGITGTALTGYFIPHPNGETAVLFDLVGNRIYEYVPSTDTWHDRMALPATLQSQYMIVCPLFNYGAWLFIDRKTGPTLSYLLKPNF